MAQELIFLCSNCGSEHSKWSGRCSVCGEWNTLRETAVLLGRDKKSSGRNNVGEKRVIQTLDKVSYQKTERFPVEIFEIDRVLGQGIVPGAVILLAGDPGIGKSTLLMEIARKIPETVLYISGEESASQIKLRTERMKINSPKINLLEETNLDLIIEAIGGLKPKLAIIDSIQTVYDPHFPSTPGSLVQVRESALRLQQIAKESHLPIILVSHVTKEGTVAGPKTLEHLVDVVLYLEGDDFHGTRILRGSKNRFGPTDEIGIFLMKENGFKAIENPSEIFLGERLAGVSGSVVTATLEGNRPILLEIQALTSPTIFGYPKRTASGFELSRLDLLLAILQKRSGVNLASQDVYVNVVGGFKLKEPAVDLAVTLSLTSAFKNKKIDSDWCVFGEIGLSGEIRKVKMHDKRENEAKRLGFKNFIKSKILEKAIREVME